MDRSWRTGFRPQMVFYCTRSGSVSIHLVRCSVYAGPGGKEALRPARLTPVLRKYSLNFLPVPSFPAPRKISIASWSMYWMLSQIGVDSFSAALCLERVTSSGAGFDVDGEDEDEDEGEETGGTGLAMDGGEG
jgi:hypothetical protein